MVLVASLLDKTPNFAGLTRTSEVFNLEMITFPNKYIVNNAEFKGMSVTAEKWVPIIEVRETELAQFLNYYRHHGYALVGLEQTAGSSLIQDFKFPRKCVLVLGSEREGIRPDVLELLDYCVEIPQFGMIRSLNVHVSGAICVWEYTKQNYLAQR